MTRGGEGNQVTRPKKRSALLFNSVVSECPLLFKSLGSPAWSQSEHSGKAVKAYAMASLFMLGHLMCIGVSPPTVVRDPRIQIGPEESKRTETL